MGAVRSRGARWGILACLLALAASAAVGCSRSSETPQIIIITPPPGPATPGPTPVVDSVLISSNAPDSRWTVTFKKPVISGIPDAAAASINDAIVAQVNGYISAFTGMNLPAVIGANGPSTLQGDFSIALDTPTLLSLRFTMLQNIGGGVHPTATPGSINFEVSSGTKIALTDVLVDPAAALPVLSSQTHSALAASLGSDLTWSGSATSLDFFDIAWALTASGLEFTFAQGALASMAAGTPTATLAWSSIKSIVKPNGPAGEFIK